jgi:hypothetical protein
MVLGLDWSSRQFTLPAGDYTIEFPAQTAGTYKWRLLSA